MNRANPTYCCSALVAIGEVLLASGELGVCATPADTAFGQLDEGDRALSSVSPTLNWKTK